MRSDVPRDHDDDARGGIPDGHGFSNHDAVTADEPVVIGHGFDDDIDDDQPVVGPGEVDTSVIVSEGDDIDDGQTFVGPREGDTGIGNGFDAGDLPEPTTAEGDRPEGLTFLRGLVASGKDAALWSAFEVAADILVPHLGVALRGLHVGVKLVGALESFNAGRGVEVEIPVADVVVGLYSVSVSIRIGEAEPPPLPAFGVTVEENWPGAAWLNAAGLDGAAKPTDAVAMAATGDDRGGLHHEVGMDLEQLVRRAAERAHAAGDQGESWSWLVAGYLDPRTRTGCLAAGYRDAPYLFWIDLAVTECPGSTRPGR